MVFVIVGSIGLAAWLQGNFRRENRDLFATLAQTNADFIRRSHLAHSQQMATDLGRILGVEVRFRTGGGYPAAGQGVIGLDGGREAIAVPLDGGSDLVLVRREVPLAHGIFRPGTLLIFGVFWGLSLALAATLTRGIARPLRLLAARLPRIEEEGGAGLLPGAERNDEIGLLARTYLATHALLVAERVAREKAERLALLGKMTTGLAHEIHNPLAGIRMHLQLLESAPDGQLREAVAESAPVALGEIAKIETLVNQWMFLVRPAPPQVSPALLGPLVENVLRPLQPLAAHARVSIETEIPAPLRANVDARRLGQAAGNIVINAIQAMPGGGVLRISGRAEGAKAILEFRDTGRGFSPEALAHYAELFFSEKEGGMGIGLSVASEIVKAHGGVLRVANEGGAIVTVELP